MIPFNAGGNFWGEVIGFSDKFFKRDKGTFGLKIRIFMHLMC